MKLKKASYVSLTVILIISHLISIVYGAYPQHESYITYDSSPVGDETVQSYTFQSHNFYSNLTHCYYIFYTDSAISGGSLIYVVYDGNENLIGKQTLQTGANFGDFDVTTNIHGNRIYLFFQASTGDNYVMYLSPNIETKMLDILSLDEVVSNGEFTAVRGFNIFCSKDGIVVSMSRRITSVYDSFMMVSNSTTNFVSSYNTTHETLWIGLGGANPTNSWFHFADIEQFGNDGLVIGYVYDDRVAPFTLTFGIMMCSIFDYDVYNISVNNGWWRTSGDYNNYDDIPDDANGFPMFDVAPAFNGENVTSVYIGQAGGVGGGGNTRLMLAKNIYNTTTKQAQRDLNTTLGSDEQGLCYIVTNDRRSDNIIFVKENTPDKVYRYRFFHNNNTWKEYLMYTIVTPITWKDNWIRNNYSRSVGFTSQEGAFGEGTPSILQHDKPAELGNIVFYLDTLELGLPPDAIREIKLDGEIDTTNYSYGVLIAPYEEHTIDVTLHNNTDYFYFKIEDNEHVGTFYYNLTSDEYGTSIKKKVAGTPLNLMWLDDFDSVVNTSKIYQNYTFTFVVNDDVIDFYNDTIRYGAIIDTMNQTYATTSLLKYSIFNLGEIPVYSGSGGYSFHPEIDILSLDAHGSGSWSKVELLYDKLEHMHFKVDFNISGVWDAGSGIFLSANSTGGYYDYGINYIINNTLITGWYVRLYPSNVVVGHQNAGIDLNYVQWTIEHYVYNGTQYILEKIDILYSNFEGYDNENATPDYHNTTICTFWFDMWFSNENNSKRVATRVNSEYYGLYEQGSAWWFGYGAFRPMMGEVTESMFYDNVHDSNGNIISATNIDYVEFWSEVGKVTGNDRIRSQGFLMKNKRFAEDILYGVDTPALVETKVLDMPQMGFLAPLIKMLSRIREFIVNGIISVLGLLGKLVDNLLVAIGLPPLMSVFYNFLVGIYNIFEVIFASFGLIVDWIVISLQNFISSIFLVIPRYLYFVGMVVTVFIDYYNNIVLLFTGGIGGMNNFWVHYNVAEIIELYLIAIFPFIEIARIESSDEPLQTLSNDVSLFVNFIKGIFEIAGKFLEYAMNIIKAIIGVF